MKNIVKLTAACCVLLVCHFNLYAQQSNPSVTVKKSGSAQIVINKGPQTFDSVRNKWFSSLVLLRSVNNKANGGTVKDTAVGTGFLLSDNGKFYLVTAKNIITTTQYSKTGQLPNDTVSVSYLPYRHMSFKLDFKLSGLSGKCNKHPAVAFTGDGDNIAIISLQKKEYKEAVADLLARGCMPVPIDQLDTGNDHHAGERLGKYGRDIMGRYDNKGTYESMDWAVCYIHDDDPALPFFTINKIMLEQGTSGSIAIANDKLVGVMTDGTEGSAEYIGQQFHSISVPAKFTKPASILACLRKLQQMEADPAFDN